jgi:hypothetical protein
MRKNLLTIQLSLYGFAGKKNSKKITIDTFHAECTQNLSLGTGPIKSCYDPKKFFKKN